MSSATAELAAFEERLRAAGLDPNVVLDEGARYAAELPAPLSAWLDPIEVYLRKLTPLPDASLWSLTHFVVKPLLDAAQGDAATFGRLLRATTDALETLSAQAGLGSRFEQYALPTAAAAFRDRPLELERLIVDSTRLLRAGADMGWLLVQLAPPLAQLPPQHFNAVWSTIDELITGVRRRELPAGYPLAEAVAALLSNQHAAAGNPPAVIEWFHALSSLISAAGADRMIALLSEGIAGLGRSTLPAAYIHEAIGLSVSLLDRGYNPTPLFADTTLSPLQVELAARLADAGVDPQYVVLNGARVFERLGWLEDDGEKLFQLAGSLHRAGGNLSLLFGDGLEVLVPLEQEYGLGTAAFELVRSMIQRGVDPGVTMRWSLPRALNVPGLGSPSLGAAEVLWFTRELVSHDLHPDDALIFALGPLVELAQRDRATFERLTNSLIEVAVRLRDLGLDYGKILFRGTSSIAEAGPESTIFTDLLQRLVTLTSNAIREDGTRDDQLIESIAIAARASTGKPWMLCAALDAANRLSVAGQHDEADALLRFGLTPSETASAVNEAEFRRALTVVEHAFASIPAEYREAAAAAVTQWGSADPDSLSVGLEAVSHAISKHGAALTDLVGVLEAIAAWSKTAVAFGPAVDAFVGATRTVAPAYRATWFAHALPLIASRSPVPRPERDTSWLSLLSKWLNSEPRERGMKMSALLMNVAEEHNVIELLERLSSLPPADLTQPLRVILLSARDARHWREMLELLPAALRDASENVRSRYESQAIEDLIKARPDCWATLVAPLLRLRRKNIGTVLATVRAMRAALRTADDDAVVIDVLSQWGVRGPAVLRLVLDPLVHQGSITALGEHRQLLSDYRRDVGIVHREVYLRYVKLMKDPTLDARAKRTQVEALGQALVEHTTRIRAGAVRPDDETDPMFGVALEHVFPPAVSASHLTYTALYHQFPDRAADVERSGLPVASRSIAVPTGAWVLRDAPIDRAPFAWFVARLPEQGSAVEPITAEQGWVLLSLWGDGRLARPAVKEPIITRLLQSLPVEERLPPLAESAVQLIALRDLATDRLLSLVEESLVKARDESPERYERLVRAALTTPRRVGQGLVKAIAKTTAAARSGSLDETLALTRLHAQLDGFVVGDDDCRKLIALGTDELRDALEVLTPMQIVLEPGKENARVHQELIGQQLQQMSQILSTALVYQPESQPLELTIELSKRRAHAAIGYCEGVCIASDLELWNRPDFLQAIIWEGAGPACGGIHVLLLEEQGERFLVLASINPSSTLLERTSAKALLKAVLKWAHELARDAKLTGVWVPTTTSIHSNRHQVSRELLALALPERKTAGHQFSYSPYPYKIHSVFELPAVLPDRW